MMAAIRQSSRMALLSAAAVVALAAGPLRPAVAQSTGATVTPLRAEKLPNVPGKTMTVVAVEYAPGGTSKAHVHPNGSVFAYVVSGAVRSQLNDGPVVTYRAGESWFEPPGTRHRVSENASASEPAKLIAVFVADDGAPLTTYDE